MSNHLAPPAVAGDRHCQFCAKKLSIMNRLFGSGFCNGSHQLAYAHRQQEVFLARLHMGDPVVAEHPIPRPPLRTPRVETEKIDPIVFSAFIKC
jgi:hypothetical protein